ncbi:N-acetyltransferase family protein [Streptomyces sp. CA-250714]|uniref:GNAT family N-acetyltransferase n=1 Tax=Streptomyces sp. CA-250714 TaxID=3240060 RepID=UPI003D8C127E
MTTTSSGSAARPQEPPDEEFAVRRATAEDLPEIVALLADDALGAGRETPSDLAPYRAAFDRIAADSNQHLVVAEFGGRTVGTLHLTVIPGLSRRGSARSLIEAVRIHTDLRGSGLGTRLIEWAVDESRRLGCALVQLTSDATRVEAHRFYERLGFQASHLGFKMPLA